MGNTNLLRREAEMTHLQPHLGDSRCQELDQATSRASPPFFQKRLANKQKLKQHVKHYYHWLHSTIHHKTKISQSSPDSLRIQVPSKRSSSGRLYPVSSFKERNRKSGKCKICF